MTVRQSIGGGGKYAYLPIFGDDVLEKRCIDLAIVALLLEADTVDLLHLNSGWHVSGINL